jgi:hypothetical protein
MAFDPTSFTVESLIQYGAIGFLLSYFLVVDYFERKRKNAREDADIRDRKERDKKTADREESCLKSNAELRRYYTEVIVPLINTSNDLHKATLRYLKNRSSSTLDPIEPFPFASGKQISDDDTRIIERNKI